MYVGRSDQYLAPLLDMERVEVLRGPQGVLFGKNTIGGVINIVSSSPDLGEDFSGSVVAEYVPEWNTQRYEGFLDATGPQNEDWAIRGTALWQATEALEFNLKVSSSKTQIQGQASTLPQFSLAAPPPVLLQTGYRLGVAAYSIATAAFPGMAETVGKEFTTYLENTNTNNPNGADLSSNNIVLNASLVLGDYEIKSTTSYSEFENDDGADVDFSALSFIAVGQDQEFSQYTQELTLYSPTGGKFEFIAGLYYDEQDLYFYSNLLIDGTLGQPALVNAALGQPSLFRALTGGLFPADQIAEHTTFDQESSNWSVFAEGTFHFTETFSLTGGLRYAEDTKEARAFQIHSSTATGGLGFEQAVRHPILDTIFSIAVGSPGYDFPVQDRSEDHLIPAFKLEWSPLDSTLLYARYAEGYKAGGYDNSGTPDRIDLTTPGPSFEFEDEEATTYELGAKFDFPAQSLRFSLSAFTTDYQDLQVSSFVGTSFTVSNAAEATIQGVEADFQWSPLDGLVVGGSAAWLDFEFDAYSDGPCTIDQIIATRLSRPGAECVQDLKGQTGVYTPEFSGSIYADYTVAITDSLNLMIGAELNHVDEFYLQPDLDKVELAEATDKIDVRLGLAAKDGQWELILFGRNITDEQTRGFGTDLPLIPGAHFAFVGSGKEWGGRVRLRF